MISKLHRVFDNANPNLSGLFLSGHYFRRYFEKWSKMTFATIDRFTKGRITAPRPDLRLKLICVAQHRYSNKLTMIRSRGNWGIKYLGK